MILVGNSVARLPTVPSARLPIWNISIERIGRCSHTLEQSVHAAGCDTKSELLGHPRCHSVSRQVFCYRVPQGSIPNRRSRHGSKIGERMGPRKDGERLNYLYALSVSTEVDDADDNEPNKAGKEDARCDSGSRSQIVLPKGLVIAWLVAPTTQERYQGWAYVRHTARSATLPLQWRIVQPWGFFKCVRHAKPPLKPPFGRVGRDLLRRRTWNSRDSTWTLH